MLGLGKKPMPAPKSDVPVVTIPTEFYAGANPTITFKQVEKVIEPKKSEPVVMPVADKKALDKATAAGANDPLHPVHVFGNRKKLIIIAVALFLLFIAGGSGYAWWQSTQARKSKTPQAPQITVNQNQQNNAVIPAETIIPVDNQPATTTSNQPAFIEFPSLLLTKAEDGDNDGLTDPEEEAFVSDPGVPDSDDDSFLDGSEVFHLYNPVGKEPIKLIESGTVQEYINPVFGYSVYYPINWALGNVDPEYRDVLFSTITGENIQIKIFDKEPQVTFSEWLASVAPSERFGDIGEFITRFNDPGLKRYDDLVYYFVAPTRVYVMVYHVTNGTVVNYPGVIEMMARSFKRDATKESIITVPVTPVQEAVESESIEMIQEDMTTTQEENTVPTSTTTTVENPL